MAIDRKVVKPVPSRRWAYSRVTVFLKRKTHRICLRCINSNRIALLLAVRANPVLQSGERHIGFSDFTALNENRPFDGWPGIAPGIDEPQDLAVRKADPRRPLHLDKKHLDPVAQPDDWRR